MQSGGLLLIYKIQQSCVQIEMLQEINSKQVKFQKLTLTLSEFQKCKINSNELSLNEKMYDYTSAVVTGNTVHLLVVNDIKEEGILEKIKVVTHNSRQQNNQLPNQISKFLTLTYIFPTVEKQFYFQEQQNIFLPYSVNIVSFTSDILSPPPELV